MKDIINSFKAHLYERTSSPLIGAFIFYWLIFNYKIIVILFDEKINSNEKFTSIEKLYVNDYFYNIPLNGLIYPIITTLIYLLIFPWISNLIFQGWTYHQNELKKIGNKKVLTYKEYGELQRKFTELELSFDDIFNKKDIEIKSLQKQIDDKNKLILDYQNEIEGNKIIYNELDKRNSDLANQLNECNSNKSNKDTEIHNLNTKINELQNQLKEKNPLELDDNYISVLKLIGEFPNGVDINNIKAKLNFHRLKIENILDSLVKNKYIRVSNQKRNQNYLEFYYINDEGKKFLLNNNFL